MRSEGAVMATNRWTGSGLEKFGISKSVLRTLDSVERTMGKIEQINKGLGESSVWKAIEETSRVATKLSTSVLRASAAFERTNIALGGVHTKAIVSGISPPAETLPRLGSSYNAISNLSRSVANPASNPGLSQTIHTFKDTQRLLKSYSQPPIPKRVYGSLGTGSSISAAYSAASVRSAGARRLSSMVEGWQSPFSPKDVASDYGWTNTTQQWRPILFPKDHVLFKAVHGIKTIGHHYVEIMRPWTTMIEQISRQASGVFDAVRNIDWEALERAWLIREARRPRTKIGFAARGAYDALYLGEVWVVDRFLTNYLDIKPSEETREAIKPSEETREALWIVLREAFERTVPEPATWIMLDDKRAKRYLRVSVYNEVSRLRRDQEMEDRIWWPEGEEEADTDGRKLSKPALSAHSTLDFIVIKSPSPETLLIPRADPRGQVLQMLYLKGTPQDKKMVEMLIAGYDLPAIAEIVGWPEVQRFQRKAQRWTRTKL